MAVARSNSHSINATAGAIRAQTLSLVVRVCSPNHLYRLFQLVIGNENVSISTKKIYILPNACMLSKGSGWIAD